MHTTSDWLLEATDSNGRFLGSIGFLMEVPCEIHGPGTCNSHDAFCFITIVRLPIFRLDGDFIIGQCKQRVHSQVASLECSRIDINHDVYPLHLPSRPTGPISLYLPTTPIYSIFRMSRLRCRRLHGLSAKRTSMP